MGLVDPLFLPSEHAEFRIGRKGMHSPPSQDASNL